MYVEEILLRLYPVQFLRNFLLGTLFFLVKKATFHLLLCRKNGEQNFNAKWRTFFILTTKGKRENARTFYICEKLEIWWKKVIHFSKNLMFLAKTLKRFMKPFAKIFDNKMYFLWTVRGFKVGTKSVAFSLSIKRRKTLLFFLVIRVGSQKASCCN